MMCIDKPGTAVRKPFILILLLSCVMGIGSRAQSLDNPGSAQGMVTDSLTGKAIPFATVSVYRRDTLVNGAFTDSLGQFVVKGLPFGTYHFELSAVGYRTRQTVSWPVSAEHPAIQAGILALHEEVKSLQTVTIKGQKPLIEQRVDGINFNVESLPIIAGGDASDVLRKVPLLTVDANGGLSMRGSANIRVFIDGKPSDIYASSVADALKSISGESIVRVEVITHPSARYDAEGTDGVVNIITRKVRDNITNGKISGVLAIRSTNVMGDVQRKAGKWLMKVDGLYQMYRNRNGSVIQRQSGPLNVVQKNESRQTGRYLFGGASVLYSLDSLNTLNLGYRIRSSPNRTNLLSDNFNTEDGAPVPTFQREITTPFRYHGDLITAGYTGMSKNRQKEFSLLGTYFLSNNTTGYDLVQTGDRSMRYKENFNSKTLNRDLMMQADYSHSINGNWKWETGGKLTRKNLRSNNRFGIYDFDNEQYAADPVRSNHFSYISAVYALYVNTNFQIEKWQFMTGLRYEQTGFHAAFKESTLEIPSFQNLVPNFLISRNLARQSTFKLGYTVKLVRPGFTNLNPTVNNSDSLNVQFGNPYLRPEITRRYQLSYSRNGPHLFTDIALFYNRNRNSIENVRTPRPDGIFESTWQNIGRNQRLGLSTTLNWKPSTKISLSGTLTLQYAKLESPVMRLTNSGLMREVVLNYSHKLPKGYSIDFYGFFDAANIQLQGYRSGWKFYNATFNKKAANDRFNISLRLEAFLKPYAYIDDVTQNASFYQIQTTRYQMQNIRLTFSFKLGKKEINAPRIRHADTPE